MSQTLRSVKERRHRPPPEQRAPQVIPGKTAESRALEDLRQAAAYLDQRGLDPLDILQQLILRSLIWRASGAAIPDGAALQALRSLPGLEPWDLAGAFGNRYLRLTGQPTEPQDEGVEPTDAEAREWRRRVCATITWLSKYAGTREAEVFICGGEAALVADLEEAVAEEIAI